MQGVGRAPTTRTMTRGHRKAFPKIYSMRLKAAKRNMPQEEGEKGIANIGSLQQPVNSSGSNSLGLNTLGGFRAVGTW